MMSICASSGCALALGLDSGNDVADGATADAGDDESTRSDAATTAESSSDDAAHPADATSDGDADSASDCPLGFGDCNGNPNDGCETRLDGPGHCGSCTTVCPPMNLCVLEACCGDQNAPCTKASDCCSNQCTDDKCDKP